MIFVIGPSTDRKRNAGTHTDRGQTVQDFAIGMSIFLLVVAFVFAFVPTILAPHDAGVGGSEAAQADRVATAIGGTLSEEGTPNTVDGGDLDDYFDDLDALDDDELREEFGLPLTARTNVTVANVSDGEVRHEAGQTHRADRATTTATRIVRTTDDEGCDPACRITVRVW